jgi:ATP-dependent Clp protease ATP-binding subunit ClpB
MLARGELRLVGATTLDEYRKHIEKDAALERRFQQVLVGEPSVEDTVGILRGLKERYEVHHGVRITDAALVAAATLSDRYITARFLPDKAIDLVDEAASRLRMEIDSRPVEIDTVERAVRRLEIEEMALEKESDAASVDRLAALRAELAERREELSALTARWQNERGAIEGIRELKEQLESLRGEYERADRDGNLGLASELLYGRIPAVEKKLAEATDGTASGADVMLKEEVGSPRGPASPPAACWRARRPSSCAWRTSSAAASSGRPRPSGPCPTPCAGPVRASPTRTGRRGRSCSSARRAWARPSWPRRWRSSCSTTSARWCAST